MFHVTTNYIQFGVMPGLYDLPLPEIEPPCSRKSSDQFWGVGWAKMPKSATLHCILEFTSREGASKLEDM